MCAKLCLVFEHEFQKPRTIKKFYKYSYLNICYCHPIGVCRGQGLLDVLLIQLLYFLIFSLCEWHNEKSVLAEFWKSSLCKRMKYFITARRGCITFASKLQSFLPCSRVPFKILSACNKSMEEIMMIMCKNVFKKLHLSPPTSRITHLPAWVSSRSDFCLVILL